MTSAAHEKRSLDSLKITRFGMTGNMDESYLQLRVIYDDPDIIEHDVRVAHGEWSVRSSLYASRSFFEDEGPRLLQWVRSPKETLRIEGGADTGIGWLVLEFYLIDSAGHARCAISLADKNIGCARLAQISRFSIEMPTELGLVERFGREWVAAASNFKRCARLIGLPV